MKIKSSVGYKQFLNCWPHLALQKKIIKSNKNNKRHCYYSK